MKQFLAIAIIAVFIVSCSSQPKKGLVERELKAGESIQLEWGKYSMQETGKNGILYLEIVKWPEKGLIVVPGLETRVHDVFLKAKPKYHFAWRFYQGDLQIHTSSFKGGEDPTILVVKTKGKVMIRESAESGAQV